MQTTMRTRAAAVSVPVPAALPIAASCGPVLANAVACHVARASRLAGGGRGTWRGQTSGWGTSMANAAPAANAAKPRMSGLDRVNQLDRRNVDKQFRTTVYEGSRPWKVPV